MLPKNFTLNFCWEQGVLLRGPFAPGRVLQEIRWVLSRDLLPPNKLFKIYIVITFSFVKVLCSRGRKLPKKLTFSFSWEWRALLRVSSASGWKTHIKFYADLKTFKCISLKIYQKKNESDLFVEFYELIWEFY